MAQQTGSIGGVMILENAIITSRLRIFTISSRHAPSVQWQMVYTKHVRSKVWLDG